jgi:mono/diheme cytochrome c family protein
MQIVRSITQSALFLLLLGFAGCDSLGEAAAQGTEASLRTLIDLLLTDFTNQVADSLLPGNQPPSDQNDDQDDDGTDDPPDSGDDEPDQGDGPLTFIADIQPLLNDRCVSCHSPGGLAQMQGIPWDYGGETAFEDLINQPSSMDSEFILVVPGDPDSSLFFLKVNSDSPPVGAMMPFGGPPLADGEVELIRLWIEQGAVEDEGAGVPSGSVGNGAVLYADNSCVGCHCADASGGCALSAPALVGAPVELLDTFLRGGESHVAGSFPFDDQDLADLAAYLASL